MSTGRKKCVVGYDASSSGAKALAMGRDGKVIALGQATYQYVQGLPKGQCRLEQATMMRGVRDAGVNLRAMREMADFDCDGTAAGGAMHGLNVLDGSGNPLDNITCWDDGGDEEHGLYLSEQLGVPIPRRFTFARWLGWKKRNPDKAKRAARVMTPSGYVTYYGCGQNAVLPGDASGMVGYMANPARFDLDRLGVIDEQFPALLPRVAAFGEKIGEMTDGGAQLFGWPAGVPWAAPCGDQPLGSYGKGCSRKGDISVELGQSIVVNVFGFRVVLFKRGLVEALRSTLGEDMMMCCVTNGVQAYAALFTLLKEVWGSQGDDRTLHDFLADKAAAVPPGAGGLMALPFFVPEGSLLQGDSFAALLGLSKANFNVGNIVRAFMETPILILKKALQEMGVTGQIKRVVLSGGGAKDKLWGQIIADIFGVPVIVSACTEAVAFGAALNALAMVKRLSGEQVTAQELADAHCQYGKTFTPNTQAGAIYDRLVEQVLSAEKAMGSIYALQQKGFFAAG